MISRERLLEIARHYGTPVYVYDLDEIRRRYRFLKEVFADLPVDIHYAVKANDHPVIVRTIHDEGGKFDTVSWEEVEHLQKWGIPSGDILYTPSCPSEEELKKALASDVSLHTGEMEYLEWIGKNFPGRPIGLRINPGMDIGGNKKIATAHKVSKFGIPWAYKDKLLKIIASSQLPVTGLHVHLGSDIHHTESIARAVAFLFDIQKYFPQLEYVDIGGGFKIPYHPMDGQTDWETLTALLKEKSALADKSLRIKIEPGKFLTAPAGTFLMEVTQIKETPWKTFACVNSGFNHFIRPMYYGAYHVLENLSHPGAPVRKYDVVGYLCEEDTFAYDRELPELRRGDIVALKNAGAYGRVMASRYNLRPLPKEVAVEGDKIFEI